MAKYTDEQIKEVKNMQSKDYPNLRNCPFCGSENIDITDHYQTVVFVQCDDCGATFPHFDSKQEAIEAWNRRADNDG